MEDQVLKTVNAKRDRTKAQMKALQSCKYFSAKEKVQLSILYRELITFYTCKIEKIRQNTKTKMIAIENIDVHFAMIFNAKQDAFFLNTFSNNSIK